MSVEADGADFDGFWRRSLARHLPDPGFRSSPAGSFDGATAHDVRFAGFDGQPIAAWLHVPARLTPRPACVVRYLPFGNGRGGPELHAGATGGHVTLTMDSRGQGFAGPAGATPDPGSPDPPGLDIVVRGIRNRESYYYRRLFIDAVAAARVTRVIPETAGLPLVVEGLSQGGGIALAAAALAGEVSAAVVNLPFLCDLPSSIRGARTEPYLRFRRYLEEHPDEEHDVLRVLQAFDGVGFARRCIFPALFSVGMLDDVCPPASVELAYAAWAGPKRLERYPSVGHEGGGAVHDARRLSWLDDVLAAA
jgi:cephalosporin-C deacetylase